ncbi:hypothetical protein NM688_g6026 [Phlebia brevispora]|uniref:Uncharacterized protein n=1 Tax=Phlebia brevispora TaxID=194682 RepID=A0ACC1SL10_9APHY|nr:hypothetical protein NM688_g6026 [Phlebia brevispora]
MAQSILPPELISRILDCVHSDCSLTKREDLISCSLVSRAWHNLTLSLLRFREVSFTYFTGSQHAQPCTGNAIVQWEGAEGRTQDEGVVTGNSSMIPTKSRALAGLLALFRAYPAIAMAVHELSLVANLTQGAHVTDPSLFIRLLQHLPHLRILHITDVVFAGPIDGIFQAREGVNYQLISLERLSYNAILSYVDSSRLFDMLDVVSSKRILHFLGLFRHIHQLHIDLLETVPGLNDMDLPLAHMPYVERVVAPERGLRNRCGLLRGLNLSTVRYMDLGELGEHDLTTIGHLLSRATNLEGFSCDIFSIWSGAGFLLNVNKVTGFGMLKSPKLRTITFRGVSLAPYSILTLTDILHHLPRRLTSDAAPRRKATDQPPSSALTIHAIFIDEIPMNFDRAARIIQYMQQHDDRHCLHNLEDILLQLTDPSRNAKPIKLQLSHAVYAGEQWRTLINSMFPNLQNMNARLD